MSPTPLPEGLSASFRVRDALDAGVTRGRLRSHDLVRPHHGVRSTSPSASVATAARELATAMKGREVAFSHVTAARLLGMPVPTEWAPDEPLHVMTTANGRVRRPGGGRCPGSGAPKHVPRPRTARH